MAGILSVATHGSDDATKASLAFITAVGAVEAGEDVSVVLLGEAAYLAKPGVVEAMQGVGFGQMKEYVQKVVDAKIDVYVWGPCGGARGVTEDDLNKINGQFIDAKRFAQLVAEAKNVVSF